MSAKEQFCFSSHWSCCLLVCIYQQEDQLGYLFQKLCGQKSKYWSGNSGWLSLCCRGGCAFGKRINPRGDLVLKHLVFPEMLCLCRGTDALRGFSLSSLESDQPSPSPETALSDPFLASPRFLPKGMEPQGRLLPGASHGTGLGIASSPAVASHQ